MSNYKKTQTMLRKLAKDLHVRDVLENSSHFDISYETIERDINQGIEIEYLIDHSFGCNKVELKNCVLNRRMFCLLFKFIFRKLNISLDLSDYDITSSMLTFRRMMNSYGKEITNGFLLEHFHVVASIGKHKFTISFNFLIYQKFPKYHEFTIDFDYYYIKHSDGHKTEFLMDSENKSPIDMESIERLDKLNYTIVAEVFRLMGIYEQEYNKLFNAFKKFP